MADPDQPSWVRGGVIQPEFQRHRSSFALAAIALATVACSSFLSETASSGTADGPGSAGTDSPAPQPTWPSLLDGRDPFAPPVTDTPDPEALAETVEISGSINATIEGEQLSWQTGTITGEEGTTSLAQWSPFPVAVGGETYYFRIIGLPPHESLDLDGSSALGSRMEIEFIVQQPQAGQELDFAVTAQEPASLERADLFYFTEENEGTVMYELVEGGAQLTIEEATPGLPATLNGTFSGTLAYVGSLAAGGEPDMSRTIQITEGQFEIADVAYEEEFAGGAGP